MNAQEAARELGLNERTLRRAIRDGRLPAVKVGREWDIDLAAASRLSGAISPMRAVYQEALAEALQLLRAFGHESDAEELEQRHGLKYIEPQARVTSAAQPEGAPDDRALGSANC